jgi:nitroimidazol reductase NimA-like FMN-containing flavoprotein (pyridoxamine 5'-phosphate oxidase superfamily)
VSDYGLRVLDRGECDAALAKQRVGRVGLPVLDHPLVLPVVYALMDGDVVFRTAPGEKLIAAALRRSVAFEIDEYDVEARTGWSVNVIGSIEEITDRHELERARALDLPCWAGELRDRYVRIRVGAVTGRAIEPIGEPVDRTIDEHIEKRSAS